MNLTFRQQYTLKRLRAFKERDLEFAQERQRQAALPVPMRDYDWQSYCRHGSFVGDPYGGDYLCAKCEDGVSVYQEAIAEAHAALQRLVDVRVALTTLKDQGVITDWHGFEMFSDFAASLLENA